MKLLHLGSRLTGLTLFTVILAGCGGTFRGIPSHGGGKRFSEEQRVVAGAIRRAVADMNLKELRGRKVKVDITGMPSTGAGNINWGGVQEIGVSASVENIAVDIANAMSRVHTAKPFGDSSTLDYRQSDLENEREERTGIRANMEYRPYNRYVIDKQFSEGDLDYLETSLEMKGYQEGITFTKKSYDSVLHVLVDVLGTNRSRDDLFIIHSEELQAECEISYLARDLKKKSILFPCRRTSAIASYSEDRYTILPLPSRVTRRIESTEPTPFPLSDFVAVGKPSNAAPASETLPSNGNSTQTERNDQKRLASLTKKAQVLIRANRRAEAERAIEDIREIDSSYKELPKLEERFADEFDRK